MSDGGPAFPTVLKYDGSGGVGDQCGMTLLDYFAAAALTGLLSGLPTGEPLPCPEILAQEVYFYAQAMLERRSELNAPSPVPPA